MNFLKNPFSDNVDWISGDEDLTTTLAPTMTASTKSTTTSGMTKTTAPTTTSPNSTTIVPTKSTTTSGMTTTTKNAAGKASFNSVTIGLVVLISAFVNYSIQK